MGASPMMPALPDGFVLDQPTAAHPPLPDGFVLDQPQQPSVAADMAKSIPGDIVGAVHGTLGLPGNMMAIADKAGDWLNQKYADAGFNVKPNRTERVAPTSQELTAGSEKNITGPLYQPQTVPGQYLRTAIEFAPAALGAAETGGATAVPALTSIGKRLMAVLGPAAASETAGQVTKGTALEPVARVTAAFAGGAGAGKIAAALAPTGAELKTAAQAAYKHPVVKDVEFKPQAVGALSGRIQMELVKDGFRPVQDNAKSTFAVLKDLKPPVGVQSVTVDDLDAARKVLTKYSKQVDAVGAPTTNATAAAKAIGHIDDFLPNLQQSDLLRGNAVLASEKLTEARGNWAAYKRSQLADTKMENARIQAASTYGGGNINNALRQAYRPLEVNNYGKVAGWSPEAKDALKDVVEGKPVRNALRDLGRLAPTGPVNIGLHALNAAATGGASLPIAGAAYAAKKLGERGTKQAAERLSEVLRSQSPLASQRALAAPAAPQRRLTPLQRRLMASALALPAVTGR